MPDASFLLPPEGDDFLALGQNSYLKPQKLPVGQYIEGMNILCRGGSPQTRPGSRTVLTIPDGNFQGITLFTPANGVAHLVWAVDGRVYAASHPFTSCVRLPGIQFSPTAPFIAWASCLKSTYYTPEGVIEFHANPYSVLVMQDGFSRAAYWDGTVSSHLDPTPSERFSESGEILSVEGRDGTPIGLWMIWSNDRLWVSRGNQVFASDAGNPLKFTEGQYLNEARAFYLPGPCTGMAEVSDNQGIICFTESTGTFLQSSIRDRTEWLNTPQFQKTILPNIGCVAPRSIVNQYGMLWWYSTKGLISLNDALRINFTSRLDIQDNEMFSTKYAMSYDMSRICGAQHENLLLMSVPYADVYNTRTMVLDQAPFNGNVNAWASHWTGWRPIEWATGLISSEERVYFGSIDFDGKNRIWEAMTPDHTDNGVPITCYLITREHMFQSRDFKLFHHAEVEIENLLGECSVMIAAAGTRGGYQRVGGAELVATNGQIYGDQTYGYGANQFGGSRPQTRLVKTETSPAPSECNSGCVESSLSAMVDKAFSLLIAWSGRVAINSYRIFATSVANSYEGECNPDETGPRLLTEEGCGSGELFSSLEAFESYTSTKTHAREHPDTEVIMTHTATATSRISQADADRKAQKAAEVYVQTLIGEM
jgi:hypothetical protein